MTERPEPDEVIDYGQMTLRRYRDDDLADLVRAVNESEDHLRPWLPWVAGHSVESGFTEVGRRPIDPRPPEGTGVGVVWRLAR